MILVKHVIGKMNLRLEIGEISLGKDIQKRELYTFSGNVVGTTTIGNSAEVPQKIKNRTAI